MSLLQIPNQNWMIPAKGAARRLLVRMKNQELAVDGVREMRFIAVNISQSLKYQV
jgi:hypothetical protein